MAISRLTVAWVAYGSQKKDYMNQLASRVGELWQIVNTRLEHKQYMYGNKPTIIDYLITVYVGWGNVFPELNIPTGNNVLNLVKRIKDTPQFRRAFKEEAVEYNIPANALSV